MKGTGISTMIIMSANINLKKKNGIIKAKNGSTKMEEKRGSTNTTIKL